MKYDFPTFGQNNLVNFGYDLEIKYGP